MAIFNRLKAKRFFMGAGGGNVAEVTSTAAELNKLDGVTATTAELNIVDGVTATAAEINAVDNSARQALMSPGTGISSATGEVVSYSIWRNGNIVHTNILVDVTGLASGTVNTFIGRSGWATCSIGQITTANNGVIWGGRVTCLETPVTGDDDINLIYSTASTGSYNQTGGTVLVNAGDATKGASDALTADPPANAYLYLQAGTGDAVGSVYTAGQFLIELWGNES